MKKILSLLSLLMLCIVGMNAQETIYSWESPEGTPIETGGTAAYVNGSGDNRVNYKNGDYYTICLNGKKANVNDTEPSTNAGKVVITLDNELAAGDVITLTAYITKNESKKSSAYFIFEKGGEIESAIFSDEANIYEDFGGSPKTVTVTVPEEAAGSKTITMTRGQTGTNLFITKLVITGERSSGETYAIGANVNGMGANMDLTLTESATLPYTATFADCYRGAMGSDPSAMIQIQNAEVTSGTNVTLGTLNGWDTTFTIDEEGTSVISLTLNMGAMTITVNVTKNGGEEPPVDTALDIAKTKLQNAINAVSAYGFSELNDAITAAQAALDDPDATVESLEAAAATFEAAVNAYLKGIITMALNMAQTLNVDLPAELISNASALVDNEEATTQDLASAMFALLNTAQPYVKELLQQAVELATVFGIDTTAAQALLDNPEATTIEMFPVLQNLAAAAMEPAHRALNTLKNFMDTFDSAAKGVLADDLAKLEEDFSNKDIAAIKVDIKALMEKGKSYLMIDMAKLEGYAELINNDAITADVAAMKAAVEAENFLGLFAALKQFETDFLAAAPGFVQQIKTATAANKAAGKTNAIEQLEAAIEAAEQALDAEDKTIVTVGLAVRNLILALQAYEEANKVEEYPELVAPTGWTNAITNGNLASDDVSSYAAKEYPSDAVVGARIVADAGKNGSRGILVKTADETGVDGATDWDSQFWIVLNDELPIDTKLHVEFDYKASQAATAYTQAHANPGNYHHYIAIGDVNFTTEWQHFSADIVVDAAMAKGEGGDGNGTGMKSIAFNLAVERSATDYYFDNFGVWYQAPKEISDWADIIVNGDMEGAENSCFYVTEQGKGGPYLAKFTEGIGVDGSKAVMVKSADDPANDWDSQFFVRLPYQLPAGTKYRVSFDYKADKAGDFDTQSHAEPGQYIHWAAVGSGSFTTAWQTYSAEGSIPAECDGSQGDGFLKIFQTIAFNLAKNKVASEFIFDNVKFEVDADIVAELNENPDANPTPYPGSNPSTGISNVAVETVNNGAIYNLNGQKVMKGKKGLYIINGKKMVVK